MLSLLLLFLSNLIAQSLASPDIDCNWKIGNRVPFAYDFALFCRAVKVEQKGGYATYRCDGHGTGAYGVQVAAWGYWKKERLDVGAPCAGDSWGPTRFGRCYSPTWAFCLGNSTSGDCYYHRSTDECSWPVTFTKEEAPADVEVWYQYRY